VPRNATLLPELALAGQGSRLIAGIDEVGRGALAGPVTIGVTVLDLAEPEVAEVSPVTGVFPALDGVRDSKLLTRRARTRWAPIIRETVSAFSVQHRSPEDIDARGITEALREAGLQGLNAVERHLGRPLDAVILDGSHDWLTRGSSPRVHPMVKADTLSLCTAAASVLAKVERDALMQELHGEFPDYSWDTNCGYGSRAHQAALRSAGATRHHRMSWNLGI
jgi:ribonuclease HII